MREIVLILVLISQAFGAWSAIADLNRGRVPTTICFGTLSVLFYYGLGILLELCGVPYTIAYFPTFRAADSDHWMAASAILAITPWLLIVGGKLARVGPITVSPRGAASSALVPETHTVFYSLSLASAALCAWVGMRYMLNSTSIWVARSLVSADLGALIIVLYLPLHLLAFFSTQRDAQSRRGLFFLILMATAMAGSTLAIGQRTNILLPVLVILLFRGRPSLAKAGISVVALFCVASILLPMFKGGAYSYGGKSNFELLSSAFAGDVARGPLLLESLERSELIGTTTLPYPMAGYWYSLQFFVPRSVALAKGYSTASYFTGAVVNQDPAGLDWGFGIGFVEEIALNAGILAVFPGVLLYGFALAKLDRISIRWPALVPATRLAAFWMAGYHLPALLLTFAPMAGVALLCSAFFAYDKPAMAPAKRWPWLHRGFNYMRPAAAWAGRR